MGVQVPAARFGAADADAARARTIQVAEYDQSIEHYWAPKRTSVFKPALGSKNHQI